MMPFAGCLFGFLYRRFGFFYFLCFLRHCFPLSQLIEFERKPRNVQALVAAMLTGSAITGSPRTAPA
jgi:hypothetical protein